MSNTVLREKITRSVDSLERIYAVVVALAITIAVQGFLLDRAGNIMPYTSNSEISVRALLSQNGAALVAFLVTIVPFYQGMHRHLNRTYIEKDVSPSKQGFLLLDFFVFFIESCLLMAFAASLTSGTDAFIPLIVLLLVDAVWAILAHGIHYNELSNSPWKWSLINLICACVLWLCIYANWFPNDGIKLWALCLFTVIRTILDYLFTWNFYFPDE